MSIPSSSTTTTTTTKRLLTLQTSDGRTFQVDEATVTKLSSIKHMVDNGFIDDVMRLPEVDCKAMAKVLEWRKKHSDAAVPSVELKAWDDRFVNDMDADSLCQLKSAAYTLNVTELVDLVCGKLADMIKAKEVEDTINL